MRAALAGLIVGIIFGAGLALSDMVNPARVQAFLDVAGAWDPTLLFVMGAAIVPSAIGYLIRRPMDRPLLERQFFIPEGRTPDRPLLAGAALFGIGWGLVGFCPGPAISSLVLGTWQPWLFVVAMLAGMLVHRAVAARPAALVTRSSPARSYIMDLTHLSKEVSVRPQVLPHEVADVAAAGFKGIINNRPDHEAPDQPSSEELEAEAKRHGLAYWHIPIVPGQATQKDAEAFAAAVREAGGPVVAFCRTGSRSTSLWKMGRQGS